MINHSNTPTPKPSEAWAELPDNKREFEVLMVLRGYRHKVDVVEAKENGHVVLSLINPMPADERGTLLLDIEDILKEQVDQGITVWLDPQGDKSSLRKLRGIEIK